MGKVRSEKRSMGCILKPGGGKDPKPLEPEKCKELDSPQKV
jgi:hypothetical protein